MKIRIDWLLDEHKCDECIVDFATGAIVTFEDGDEIDMTPSANCKDKKDYSTDDVYNAILKKFGHKVRATGV